DYLDNADAANLGNTTITQNGGTAGGTVTFYPTTGTLDYTPLPGEAGTTVTVIYEVCNDASGAPVCATATITINVSACPSSVDTDGDGLTDCEETTGIDDPSTPDNPNDFPGGPISDPNDPCDPIETFCTSGIEVTKVANVFETDLGDTISYTITIENTGELTLTNLSMIDTFVGVSGNALSLTEDPYFSSSSLNSPEGTLLPGEIATYNATFSITQEAISSGGVSNSILVSAATPNGTIITDVSDNGDDFDGNTTDDATVTQLGCLIFNNEFSPNGDGVNDYFVIGCIENYPNNKLEVYNRWGNIVYKKQGYRNDWDGTSNGRVTINESEKLPVGTYYYVLDLGDGSKPKVGWIYINR
uniref:T9SS type B sorting domain-containing protein n=1 Tax=Yeosuana marina TaxID=1565536 RepID=UPI0030C8346A